MDLIFRITLTWTDAVFLNDVPMFGDSNFQNGNERSIDSKVSPLPGVESAHSQ